MLSSGEELIEKGHYAEKEIRIGVERLEDLWKQLQDTSQLKKERLNEAYQVCLFVIFYILLSSFMNRFIDYGFFERLVCIWN